MKFDHTDMVRIGAMDKETGKQITTLKQEARAQYIEYKSLADSCGHLDCGNALREQFRPGLAAAKQKFNETMDKLATLDPTCPSTRL